MRSLQIVITHRAGGDSTKVAIGQSCLNVPLVKLRLDFIEIALRCGVLCDIEADASQQHDDVACRDKTVFTDSSQEPKRTLPTEARTIFLEIRHEPYLVLHGPLRNKFTETAAAPRLILYEENIVL